MRPRFALGRSRIWRSIYVLCVVFVCSFILFEVIDLDGSDFPTGPAPTAVRSIAGSLDSVALRPSPFVSPRACRRLLARASLGDIPLSA